MKSTIPTLSIATLSLSLLTVCASPPRGVAEPAQPRGGSCSELKPGNYDRTVKVRGQEREYRLHVPPGGASGSARPLVIALHGGGQSGPRLQELIDMDETSDRNGFWVAYPTGTPGPGGGFTWNGGDCCGVAMRKKVDDVEFIEQMLAELGGSGCVDPARVYATGVSNGAIFSYRLACDLSAEIAAIAPIAGSLMLRQCSPARPVPAIIFHGSKDSHVKVEGGRNLMSGANRAFPPLDETRDRWLKINGCSGESKVVYDKGDSTCREYQNCSSGGDVTLCMIQGGGHTWPGGKPLREGILGRTTQDISASEVMWKFFEEHALSQASGRKTESPGKERKRDG